MSFIYLPYFNVATRKSKVVHVTHVCGLHQISTGPHGARHCPYSEGAQILVGETNGKTY